MAQTGSINVDWNNDWSGYMQVHITCTVTATVNDDVTEMKCTVSDFHEDHSWGSVAGYGFINIGGICWGAQSFDRRVDDTETPEDWPEAEAELAAAFPAYASETMFGIYASDDTDPPRVNGTFGGVYEWTFPLSGQPDIDMPILTSYSRWRDNEAVPPQAVCSSGGPFNITFHDLFPDYYPGARRTSGSWASCNRQGGSTRRREGGVWADVKNGRDTNTAFRRAGSWVPVPEYGA